MEGQLACKPDMNLVGHCSSREGKESSQALWKMGPIELVPCVGEDSPTRMEGWSSLVRGREPHGGVGFVAKSAK